MSRSRTTNRKGFARVRKLPRFTGRASESERKATTAQIRNLSDTKSSAGRYLRSFDKGTGVLIPSVPLLPVSEEEFNEYLDDLIEGSIDARVAHSAMLFPNMFKED